MYKVLKNSWALFFGFAILATAHGFQGNLLGVRAVIEEFDYLATGTLMSGYFIGYFLGANLVPKLVTRVGHIRVFAACASMASLSALVHAVFVYPSVWIAARFLTQTKTLVVPSDITKALGTIELFLDTIKKEDKTND